MSRLVPSAALPIARVVLQILVILNWLSGALLVILLVAMPTRRWIMNALDLPQGPEADQIIWGLRGIAVVALAAIPLHYIILKRLIAIVETVRAGDPFVAVNAARLSTIAWTLLTLQCMGIAITVIARTVSTPAHPIKIDSGFSINGWLAVLLMFVLARVFAEGTHMRDDLEGTV